MIDRHNRDDELRGFVDGPPSEGMIQDRFDTKQRLQPRGEAWRTDNGRECLCDAAFESGYDAAIIQAKQTIEPLLTAARDVLNASYHSEASAKATARNRLADELRRFELLCGDQLTGDATQPAAKQADTTSAENAR